MGDSKPALTSRTVWVNILSLVLALLAAALGHDLIKENPQVAAYLLAAQSVVNIALRFLSVQPIHVVGGKE